jgi:hypothetical protein
MVRWDMLKIVQDAVGLAVGGHEGVGVSERGNASASAFVGNPPTQIKCPLTRSRPPPRQQL